MRRQTFNRYIETNNFRTLFITELGWNQAHGQTILPSVTFDGIEFKFNIIAQRSGFKIIVCETQELPTQSVCKRIDTKLRRVAFDYICIYCQCNTHHHQWVAPVKKSGKRNLVSIEYESAEQATLLFTKLPGLSFGIDEVTTITDVKEKVQGTFAINSDKITKDFYRGFKVVLRDFANYITGLDDNTPVSDNRWKQWYSSIMLNRLMFCYFIQKKGFLDGNVDYLGEKLRYVRYQRGINQFYGTFYKGFLRSLFQDGLDSPNRDDAFYSLYGKIPYINGGLFASNLVENKFPQMDINDEAFIELFDFLDKWEWHLDTRMSSSGNDINPDVLGYIFEQYINDKAKMGAFYTQEDITEFIARNCIIPSFLHKLDELCDSFNVCERLMTIFSADPERYIYDSIKFGYIRDWETLLPDDVKRGLGDTKALEERQIWNASTQNNIGLPRETWRDTITRFKKCDDIISRLTTSFNIDDIITANINGRQLAQDLISTCESEKELHQIYDILSSLSILDPACGSGAFLFAAMNILEALYEECAIRMMHFHDSIPSLFNEELQDIGFSSKYFDFNLCSKIAVNNIYGVDIMPEAIEIAKLRLFLRIVSSLEVDLNEVNNGLQPLPDIDFNITCGNSLTGSCQLSEVASVTDTLESIKTSIQQYKASLKQVRDVTTLHAEKNAIIASVRHCDTYLNGRLRNDSREFAWLDGNAPLNWTVRFYDIINNGGFDIIIGNPPYIENNKLDYSVDGYRTADCGNVYTCMMERGFHLLKKHGFLGMIVQLPIVCTDRMESAQQMVQERATWLYSFDDRPGKLFENLEHIRATIVISTDSPRATYSSRYYRWFTEVRPYLLDGLSLVPEYSMQDYISIPKIGDSTARSIMAKLYGRQTISAHIVRDGKYPMYYHNAPLYFTRGTSFLPYFRNERGDTVSSSVKRINFTSDTTMKICSALLNSSLFYLWFIALSDCRHLNVREIEKFPLGLDGMSNEYKETLCTLCDRLMTDLNKNKIRRVSNGQRNGRVELDEFRPKPSKPIMDEIDLVLGKHFGFSQEELDYIINYDYKFRMGDGQE